MKSDSRERTQLRFRRISRDIHVRLGEVDKEYDGSLGILWEDGGERRLGWNHQSSSES